MNFTWLINIAFSFCCLKNAKLMILRPKFKRKVRMVLLRSPNPRRRDTTKIKYSINYRFSRYYLMKNLVNMLGNIMVAVWKLCFCRKNTSILYICYSLLSWIYRTRASIVSKLFLNLFVFKAHWNPKIFEYAIFWSTQFYLFFSNKIYLHFWFTLLYKLRLKIET